MLKYLFLLLMLTFSSCSSTYKVGDCYVNETEMIKISKVLEYGATYHHWNPQK